MKALSIAWTWELKFYSTHRKTQESYESLVDYVNLRAEMFNSTHKNAQEFYESLVDYVSVGDGKYNNMIFLKFASYLTCLYLA